MIRKEKHSTFGFTLRQFKPGIFKITHIKKGSPVDNVKKIRVGDFLIAINNIKIAKYMNLETIYYIIRKSGLLVRLTLISQKQNKGSLL